MKNNCIFKKQALLLKTYIAAAFLLLFCFTRLTAQVIIDHPVPNGATDDYITMWVVPANVHQVTVDAWGGGAGASLWADTIFNKGGQGGAYAKVVNFSVTPGDTLKISIGKGAIAGSYAGGNTSVTDKGVTLVNACGGGFYFINCLCYDYYPKSSCNNQSPVNQVDSGVATSTHDGGNAGGIAQGGGHGGIYPGGNGSVPGGGAASGTGSRLGASGRVKISYVVTGFTVYPNSGILNVYPNPSHDIFHIGINNTHSSLKYIFVYDVTGNMVYQLRNTANDDIMVNLSGLSKGYYLIKVITDNEVYINRLIHQ